MKNKIAFTLAEVLVTLVIIGVVSALTIPSVVKNYKEKQTVTALKKALSDMGSAFNMAKANKGNIETCGLSTSQDLFDYFKPYLRITKECGSNDTSCFDINSYKTLNKTMNWYNGRYSTAHSSAITDNGSALFFELWSETCEGINVNGNYEPFRNICGVVIVDINGKKNPNTFGIDAFWLYITKFGIYPRGLKYDTIPFNTYCKMSSNNNLNGMACAAWVIVKENMDYLKRNISW